MCARISLLFVLVFVCVSHNQPVVAMSTSSFVRCVGGFVSVELLLRLRLHVMYDGDFDALFFSGKLLLQLSCSLWQPVNLMNVL